MAEYISIFNQKVSDIISHLDKNTCENSINNLKITCVIYRCNPIDGILNAVLLIKAGYDVLVIDFIGIYNTFFSQFRNVKYINPQIDYYYLQMILKCNIKAGINNTNIFENYCIVIAQLINQLRTGFSILTCGINRTRLEYGKQHKYGEKGDKNFIADLEDEQVLNILRYAFGIDFEDNITAEYIMTIDENYKQLYIKKNHHKFNYPVYLNSQSRIEDKSVNKIRKESIVSPETKFPMTNKIQQILDVFRKEQGFYDENWCERFVNDKINQVINYCEKVNIFIFNLAISGGIDSSVVYIILKKICELHERFSLNVYTLPINSTQSIQSRAYLLTQNYTEIDTTSEHLQICNYIFNTMKYLNLTDDSVDKSYIFGCTKSNIRGFIMHLISSNNGGLIIGTGNEDEDAFLRFFSVYGDGFVDLDFIGDVPKFFMYRLGKFLNVPDIILTSAPSADLVSDNEDKNTDENEIGSSYQYAELLLFMLRNPTFAKEVFNSIHLSKTDIITLQNNFDKILEVHNRSKHKAVKPQNVFNSEVNKPFLEYTNLLIGNCNNINEDEFNISETLSIIQGPLYIYFGGTFSIPTKSHQSIIIETIKYMIDTYDKFVYFFIAPSVPQYNKHNIEIMSYDNRLLLCKLMIDEIYISLDERYKNMCNILLYNEMNNNNVNIYKGTYIYLNEFCEFMNCNKENVYYLMGSDNFLSLCNSEKRWLNTSKLLDEYKFLIVERNGETLDMDNYESQIIERLGYNSSENFISNHFIKIPINEPCFNSSSKILEIINSNEDINIKKQLIYTLCADGCYNFINNYFFNN